VDLAELTEPSELKLTHRQSAERSLARDGTGCPGRVGGRCGGRTVAPRRAARNSLREPWSAAVDRRDPAEPPPAHNCLTDRQICPFHLCWRRSSSDPPALRRSPEQKHGRSVIVSRPSVEHPAGACAGSHAGACTGRTTAAGRHDRITWHWRPNRLRDPRSPNSERDLEITIPNSGNTIAIHRDPMHFADSGRSNSRR
jgi:hypothetical protein